MLGLAFIIPAYKIFDDIKRRFGSEALCCHSGSPYNARKEYVSRGETSVGFRDTLYYELDEVERDLLMKGALVAQDSPAFEQIIELSEVNRDALRNQVLYKWRRPTALYFTVILCSIGAAVQGWSQIGSIGANLLWHDDFSVPGTSRVPPVPGVNRDTNSWIVGVVYSFPYIATQTWVLSRSFRWSDYQSLGPTRRTTLIVSVHVILSVPLYLLVADCAIVFPCLGGLIGGLLFYGMLQSAPEAMSNSSLHLPFETASGVCICICTVALLIASPLMIIPMRYYMPVQSGAGYPLAGIMIQDGHELQTREIWFCTSLGLGVSALSASNLAMYLASRSFGMIHLGQHEESTRKGKRSHITFSHFTQALHIWFLQQICGVTCLALLTFQAYEENARFWNSPHITFPQFTQALLIRLLPHITFLHFTQVLLIRLLPLSLCNDPSKW